jgi:hypothetical protein
VYRKQSRWFIKDAFINVGKRSGRRHVLKRPRGVGRDPAHIQYGPSVASIANAALPAIIKKTDPVFEKNLAHEINRALRKL